MKIKHLLFASIVVVTVSCSKNNDSPTPVTPGNTIVTTFLPITTTNKWTYRTEVTPLLPTVGTTVIGEDKLFVDSDILINTTSYKVMKTELPTTGFYCRTLKDNNLRVDGSSVKLTGAISVNLGAGLPLNFNVTDFTIFKENAALGDILSTTSPVSFIDNTSFPGYPLTFTYTVKSTFEGSLATFLSNNINYTDVKKTKIVVNVGVTTTLAGIKLNVLNPQNVIISNQYYSKNIGVIESDTTIEYTLTTIPSGSTIPQHGKQDAKDFLTYHNF